MKIKSSLYVFPDFSKGFNSVSHEILLEKLEHHGFRGISYLWFKSYFHKKMQVININGTDSNKLNVTCGVLQSSVLVPLLFLIYINNSYTSSHILQFWLFADDTSILFTDKYLGAQEQTITSTWLLANKLSLIVSKASFLLIYPRNPNRTINLKINNISLKQEGYTKYLGVIVEDKLNWKLHIEQVNLKLSNGIGILYKLRHLVPKRYSYLYNHPLFI